MTVLHTLTSDQQGFVREMQKIQKRSIDKERVRFSNKEKQEAKRRMKKAIREAHKHVKNLGDKEEILARCKNAAGNGKKRLEIFSQHTMANNFPPEANEKERIIWNSVLAMGFTCERKYDSEQVDENMGILSHILFITWN